MKTNALILTAGLLATALVASPAFQSSERGVSALPRNFVGEVTNPFFPLHPGTTFHYVGSKDGVDTTDDVAVTHTTRTIMGIVCTVVHDQTFEKKRVVEDTFDYYAQDAQGNVWYFGEDTRELDKHGNVTSTEGSWLAGVNGARPGIIMEASPQVGDFNIQEDAPGVAEDRARVMSLDETVTVPYGTFDHVLLTNEWTRLEPGVLSSKYYAAGVGNVLEVGIHNDNETNELVSITTDG